MTSRTGNNPRRPDGYILVELLAVMLLFAVALAVAAPILSNSYREAGFRAAVRTIAAKLTYTHRQSVAKGKTMRVAFDVRGGASWIETETGPGVFRMENRNTDARQPLPTGVRFLSMEGPGIEPAMPAYYATFYPDGTAQSRRITIQGPGKTNYELTVQPATGSVAAKKI